MIAVPLALGSIASAATPVFTGITTGSIQNPSISEASGIAASRMNPNVLWIN